LTILPEATVRKECADGSLRVVACKQMRLTRPLGIIVRRSGKLTQAADEFSSLLLGRSIDSIVPAKPVRKPATSLDATPESHSLNPDRSDSETSPGGGTKRARASVVA
jgi:hypothetical protein